MRFFQKYEFYIFNFLVAFFMTVVMAFGNTAITEGFHNYFLQHWVKSTAISLCISYPATLIIVPLASKFMKKIKAK
ncbi:DUF2798 domain-containing protein [Flavobacterium alkalisoli]|uniref:DUF2798 domain-containing protein n=1 Tax=Flavobacterium alkalisoli TaxID=2602769 RepID=A0A5B9FUX5_9FLAO|nr:DUF2798 domain-containing protein [Flavobacterium alkalisoli]